MSLSGLIEQTYLPKVAALGAILEQYHRRWIGATTLEGQLAVEAEALAMFELVVNDETHVGDVSIFEHPDLMDLEHTYETYELLARTNTSRIATLFEMFLKRQNNQMINIQELLGQVRRIKQKHAVLNLWEGEKTRYFTGTKFLSLDGVDSRFTSLDPLEVNTNQGLLTLPIQSKDPIAVNTIRIASTSNGQVGNSDVEVTTNNQNLRALISSNTTEWFEYERMDGGPCNLTLVVELQKPQIVNQVTILPVDIGAPISFKVKDIVFTTSAKESVSVFELLPKDYPDDLFQIPMASLGEIWELTFLPIEAVSVSVSLTQSQSYTIQVANTDGSTSGRERFGIAMKTLGLHRVQYKSQGGINSKPLAIRKNLFAVESILNLNPDNTNLYDVSLEISFDDGANWKLASTDDLTNILLVDRNDGSFLWRLSLIRNEAAFSTFTSFFEEEEPVGEIKTILRNVSRNSSPQSVRLTSEPADSNVMVIQPKVGRRGTKGRAQKIGVAAPGTSKIRVPFNVLKTGVSPRRARVYVGGVEYVRKQPGETLSALEWQFSDNHDEVILGPDLPAGTQVDMVLDEEQLLLEEREDGYYHQMRLEFDPDKDNIKVHYLSREPSRTSFVLPRGETIISLDKNNLIPETLVLSSTGGTIYNEVDIRDDVYDAEDEDYYVDYENGVLYLATAIGDDNVKVSFDYQEQLELESEQFHIVYENKRPWGIRINKDALEAVTVEEVIEDDPVSIIDPFTGEYGTRLLIVPNGSDTKKQLSYDYIIVGTFGAPTDLLENELLPEEVDFIDGITEFYGLTRIEDEETVETAADGSGVVEFQLAARALWFPDLGVSFGDTNVFSELVATPSLVTSGSNGAYHIDVEGTVYVKVGVGNSLRGGIHMDYGFKDPTFEPANKFSVDYRHGVLYAHSSINQEAEVTYKTASYTVGYDIARQVKSEYQSDANTVQIRTEDLEPINNLVKIIWTEQVQSTVSPTLQQYFSPLVSSLGFRFS